VRRIFSGGSVGTGKPAAPATLRRTPLRAESATDHWRENQEAKSVGCSSDASGTAVTSRGNPRCIRRSARALMDLCNAMVFAVTGASESAIIAAKSSSGAQRTHTERLRPAPAACGRASGFLSRTASPSFQGQALGAYAAMCSSFVGTGPAHPPSPALGRTVPPCVQAPPPTPPRGG
jgi:hypothetical protein